jgi:hypothetical protein
MGISLRNFFAGINPQALGNQGSQTQTQVWQGIDGAAETLAPQRLRDVVGKLKVSQSQNIYDADFEYGIQPLRWENFIQNTSGTASIVQAPGLGGVTMTISGTGDMTVRQSRPYHRYQPGKTMYMASNVNFGGAVAGQVQRVGIFDDSNGIFFQQGTPTTTNPYGMYVAVRSDSGGVPVDTVFDIATWNMNQQVAQAINWNAVQMVWMEYAWYGAGALRWGVVLNGEPYILHQVGTGNSSFTGALQVKPWSRTGNLPVRYEQRNPTANASSVMTHYGVSVLIEGGIDKQRGFTYSYGMSPAAPTRSVASVSATVPTVRYPVMSFRMRQMGQTSQDQSYNYNAAGTASAASANAVVSGTTTTLVAGVGAYTVNAYVGRMISYQPVPGGATNVSGAAVVSNATATVFGISGTTLTISGTITNTFYQGMTISGTSVTAGTIITGQQSGISGGAGVYTISISQTVASATSTLTASGSAVAINFTAAHNLIAGGPTTTAPQAGDVLTISGATTTGTVTINGVFPVVAVTSSTQIIINVGYGVTTTQLGTITIPNNAVTASYTARITSNTTTTLTFQDIVTGGALANLPTAGCNYQIGLLDRGQLLPQTMLISADVLCIVELIASTPTAEIGLNGANFQSLSALGSFNSFAQRDVSATSMSGGEVVYAFTSPASGTAGVGTLQQIDLSFFFPVLTSIKGNVPDILTIAVTVPANKTSNVGVNVICAEAMA